ncbi:MAG TPA: hypothetical protein VFA26_07310 [Gemmataceae bacterium]|nr:hypothetical protein [Gemmataceae bacterium]
MPNDAKLAMVIGVGLVVAVAIIFFHKDLVNGRPADIRPPTNGVNSPAVPPTGADNVPRRPLSARPSGLAKALGQEASDAPAAEETPAAP